MRRSACLLALVGMMACAESTAPPSLLTRGYSLATVDGKPLPVSLTDDGVLLVANGLVFDTPERPRAGTPVDGLVRYTLDVKPPGQPLEHSEVELNYQVRGNELRINLCPSLALCIAETILVGPITGQGDPLILRHYLAGRAESEYRYHPVLPE